MSEDLLVPRVMKVLLSQSVAKMDFWGARYARLGRRLRDGLVLLNKKGARADEIAFSDLGDKISLDPHYAAIANPGDPDDLGRW